MSSSMRSSFLRPLAIAWVVAGSVCLPACESSGAHQTQGLDTPWGGIELRTQSGQFDIKLESGMHGDLEFKDSEGNRIGGISADGPIDQSFPLPEGYSSYDYEVSKQDSEAVGGLLSLAGGPVGPKPLLSNWMVGCASSFLEDVSLHGFVYQISTKAFTRAQARSKFDAVAAGGPGSAVANGVMIDAWVDVQAGATSTTITSCLEDTFATYEITVDGMVVANLASGLNASLQPLGNGWHQVTTVLPNSLAGSGSTVLLTQQGVSSDAATVDLEIGGL